MHTVMPPVSMTITVGFPGHVGQVAAPNVGAVTCTTAAGLTSAAHGKIEGTTKSKPGRPPASAKKPVREIAPPQRNGGAASKKAAATSKIVFDVEGGVRKWLEGQLADGPATLDDLTKELVSHAKASGGASISGDKVFATARKAIRMYGVNPRVSNIVLNDGVMSLTGPSEG